MYSEEYRCYVCHFSIYTLNILLASKSRSNHRQRLKLKRILMKQKSSRVSLTDILIWKLTMHKTHSYLNDLSCFFCPLFVKTLPCCNMQIRLLKENRVKKDISNEIWAHNYQIIIQHPNYELKKTKGYQYLRRKDVKWYTPDGTRTHNLWIRSPTPYPLGHRGWWYLHFSP